MSKVKTIIVAIEKIKHMNNFKHLPPAFEFSHGKYKYNVIIHHNPHAEFQGTKFVTNFDLLITNAVRSIFNAIQQHCHFTMVNLVRYSKLEQAVMMSALIPTGGNIENFHHINTYSRLENDVTMTELKQKIDESGWFFGGNFDPVKRYVIKPMHGAGGYGQIVFKPSEVSVDALLCELMIPTNGLDKLKELFPGVIFTNEDNPNAFSKGIEYIKEQGCVLQEVVENIQDEYRGLISPNGLVHFYKRTRSGEGFQQATGMTNVLRNDGKVSMLDAENFQHLNELKVVIEYLNIEFGSIDVFTTTDGKWGILEWCNQFGTVAYSPYSQKEYHVDCIKQWIIQHVNMKGEI